MRDGCKLHPRQTRPLFTQGKRREFGGLFRGSTRAIDVSNRHSMEKKRSGGIEPQQQKVVEKAQERHDNHQEPKSKSMVGERKGRDKNESWRDSLPSPGDSLEQGSRPAASQGGWPPPQAWEEKALPI